ncbi:MAG: hypothetical protein M4579_005069 [Chaenotheca gracillima]|nr:MAG: hypothetical protein M4579_005069 [Chaenotheca gracillima]
MPPRTRGIVYVFAWLFHGLRKLLGDVSAVHTRQRSHERIVRRPVIREASRFQDLAFELQRMILYSICDIDSLRSIIHASPECHHIYAMERRKILATTLARDLISDEVILDALSASRSLPLRSETTTKPQVQEFVRSYRQDREKYVADLEILHIDDLTHLGGLHGNVRFVTTYFYQYTLDAIPHYVEPIGHERAISRTELIRIYRAFYRFETFCNAFDFRRQLDSYHDDQYDTWRKIDARDRADWFLSIFPPWEVEEIACVRDYIFNLYKEGYREIAEDLMRRGYPRPLETGKEFYSDEETELNNCLNDVEQDDRAEYCLGSGILFLRRFLSSANFEQRRNLLLYGRGVTLADLSETLTEPSSDVIYCNVHDTDERPLHFTEDGHGPNVGWTWSNRDLVMSNYNHYLTEPLRKWAYVMWDYQRLSELGVLDQEPVQAPLGYY